MTLPFTRQQFFDVFAAYNTAVWPVQLVLIALAVVMIVFMLRSPEKAGRFVSFGLAALWAWLAVAYHLAFFLSVNPAAAVFAAISLASAVAFLWVGGIRGRLRFEPGISARKVIGIAVIVFALVLYPAIGILMGHRYPAAPTFGLPCPTTIFTFGVLLMAPAGLPKCLVIGPSAWAVIGSTAAFALDVRQDFALLAVAVLGAYMLLRSAPSDRNAHHP